MQCRAFFNLEHKYKLKVVQDEEEKGGKNNSKLN